MKTNELIGIIICGVGIFDLVVLPKIFSKSKNLTQETKAGVTRLIKLGSYITIGLGLLVFLRIIGTRDM